MSNVRLISKLLEACVDEEQIQAMNRNEVLIEYAEIVAAGKDKPPVAVSPVAYDPEVEKQRLAFEINKYEQERKLKTRELELKERELEEARRRAEEEKIESRARYESETRLREKELQNQMDRDNASKSIVSRTKAYADALKGTIVRMPADVVHLLTYFKDVERLFGSFEIPATLQAQLLRPYLDDKAKLLVARMDPAKASAR